MSKKGHTNNPNGRPKGAKNRVTTETREAFKNLLEMNTPNMIGWMERVAEDDPAKALDLSAKLAEFVIPKLGRTELQPLDGEGKPTGWDFTVNHVQKTDSDRHT